jgi:hypothetical protein
MFSHFFTALTLLCCISSTGSVYNNVIQPLPHYTSKTIVQILHCFDHACNNIRWTELPSDGTPTRVLKVKIEEKHVLNATAALSKAKQTARYQESLLEDIW